MVHFKLGTITLITSCALLIAQPAMAAGSHSDSHDSGDSNDGGMVESGTHGHASWEPVPADYAGYLNSAIWTDGSAAARGKVLYLQSCVACHGADGTGRGPAAAALAHKPADLTKHFHKEDGVSDAYLFWRVTEGGTVAPFKSADSMMPGFKNLMTAEQRWDVLAYIHQDFHQGFQSTMPMQDMHDDSETMHDDSETMHDESDEGDVVHAD